MDLYTFFNTFSSALSSDGSLQTWGAANFDRPVMVFPNAESKELPTSDDMPYVLLASPGFTRSQRDKNQEYIIAVYVAISSEGTKTTGENIKEPKGVELISNMIELVINVFKGALPAGFEIVDVIGDSDTIGQQPEVHGALVFTFQYAGTLGSDPLV